MMWTLAVGILTLALVTHRWLTSPSDARRLPPGPKPLPIIGNVHQVPMQYQQHAFAKWGKEYGSLVYVKMFQTPMIVINSLQVAQDLLEKRSAIYSGRPRAVMLKELLAWDPELVLLDYGDQFRMHRKWVQSAFEGKEVLESYWPVQRREAYTLIENLMQAPQDFRPLIKRFTAAMIMETTYGYSVTSNDDPFVLTADEAMRMSIEAGGAASTLVDFFPILKHLPTWMPGAGFKRRAAVARPLVEASFMKPFGWVREQLAKGCARPSLAANLIEDAARRGKLEDEEWDIMGGTAGIYTAGMDTTGTALLGFLLAMTIYPDVFRKLQEEVDRVVGLERLPDFSDRESIPYLESLIKEIYRWNPPAPLSIAHCVLEDDEYNGYHIPKGSLVLPNLWYMAKNPDIYPDPERFTPERFLAMPGRTPQPDPRNIVFGHGRRICPGRNFADASLWLVVAVAAATLDIGRAGDENGAEIVPDATFISGIISHPHEFSCEIKPRSENAVRLVAQMRASVAA